MKILSVPVRVNKQLRPSRLVQNNFDYIEQQAITIIRSFVTYRPFRFFALAWTHCIYSWNDTRTAFFILLLYLRITGW